MTKKTSVPLEQRSDAVKISRYICFEIQFHKLSQQNDKLTKISTSNCINCVYTYVTHSL